AANAGDVVERSIGICLRRDLSIKRRIAEYNAMIAPELRQSVRIAKVIAFHVPNRDFQHFAFPAGVGEWRVGALNSQVDWFADVFQPGIPQQSARKQSGFAEDLKAVADAQHQASVRGK